MSLPHVERKYITEEFILECKNGNPNSKLPDPVPLLRFIYELCGAMVRGELPYQKCRAALDTVGFVQKVSRKELGSTLADVVTQMAQDLTMSGEYRGRLMKLAKWLVENALVPLRLFQERCEEEFLWEAEMIKIKAQDLKSKEVRVNTRLLYQQTKFNLLREETEGYAKLVTLLCQGSDSAQNASSATVGVIKSLIGQFDLDPNRVFDIVLDCFELQPDNHAFLKLIPIFPKSHASQILGFKFQYYQRMEVNSPVPFGLYKLTALLIKEELIDLDSIYTHLLPKDDEAFEHYGKFSAKRLDEASKIGKINLAATGKDLMEDEKQGDVTVDLYSALDMENEAVVERAPELESNQKLGLLTGFLSIGDWYHAHILLDRLSPLNPVEHVDICNMLFRLIGESISSAYQIVHEKHLQSFGPLAEDGDCMVIIGSRGNSRFVDLPKELFQMLSSAGPYLYRDTLLLQKVCRVLKGYYLAALELASDGDGLKGEPQDGGSMDPRVRLKVARSRVEEALGTCLLPSLQLIPANPAIGQEYWELMNLLPYEARYRLYGEWEKDDERLPMVLAARQTAKLDTRRILKRLAKENLKQLGRMVAKLAHANPMTVLRTIVNQIEAYRDMIAPVVDAFKYLTQLEYDILEYVVIERLARGGREKLKGDGLNLSDWLQSLASFWGHLCKKYPSMELRGLFQYLVNQLKKGEGIELVLLQELVQQMANVQYTENLTEEQLDAMAGGETLRYQATAFGVTRNNKALIKSTNRLRDSLLSKDEPKLAVPLLLLIAQYRSVVVINADAPYIKVVSEQFDRCHGTLLQYVEFLSNAVTPTIAYAQLIPSLDDIVHQYHVDPEVAFLIYRPVMRLFKCQGSNMFWPLEGDGAANTMAADSESESTEWPSKLVLDLGSSRQPTTWSDLLGTVKTMLPSKAWNSLSPDLYATFWGLTLYDLYVPRNRYESEISKLHASLKALEELPDNSSSAITKRKKEKEKIQESLDRLSDELQRHEKNVASVRRRLLCEKDKWLSSCPDTLKINMEFLQRCIFPRCTFSMPDAVYCAMFVYTLHSLGTPFFNTVNHIDVLICKTLQPMICCCTEYEAGRLGRFLYETLKIAYHWKSDESVYERECGNMPGFAVYYRYPNSQRVTYGQFIKVHWKWSQRITKLLIHCLESAEYMEIRNALIVLTKISGVFPVTRKTGINLEKRVAKIKSDEREDLKVLATGVAAALAARKPSWVTDEDFGLGHLDLKPVPSLSSKSVSSNVSGQQHSSAIVYNSETLNEKAVSAGAQYAESGSVGKEQIVKTKVVDGKVERAENASHAKSDCVNAKLKDIHASVTSSAMQAMASKSIENKKSMDDSAHKKLDENMTKASQRDSLEAESGATVKQPLNASSLGKTLKQDMSKDDSKSGKYVGRSAGSSASERDVQSHSLEGGKGGSNNKTAVTNGSTTQISSKGSAPSSRHESSTLKSYDKLPKRSSPAEESERSTKRKKGDIEGRDKGDADGRDIECDIRYLERERSIDSRYMDLDRPGSDERSSYRVTEKALDRSKDRSNDKYERDLRDRLDHSDKSRGIDNVVERSRDKSLERYGRERSVERVQERCSDRLIDKAKDERKRQNESSSDKSHVDDRFHGQNLPPPPPLPPHVIPHSLSAGRRDEDSDRRFGSSRHSQRLSPRHDERRRSEESHGIPLDDVKRRREDEFRERKRDEREASMKIEESDRDREKVCISKDDMDAGAKRRKLKREHLPTGEPGEYSPGPPPASVHPISMSQSSYDGRDGGDRKGSVVQRAGYIEEPSLRMHGKEVVSKMTRRDIDPIYDRVWEDEKRLRGEPKRRHRK